MGSSTRLAFEPSATPLGMYGAPDCCQEKASVALQRCDTLGRPRPFSNPGKLRHVNEQEHTGNLQPDPEARDDHLVRFADVTVGQARWHWPEEPAGEHLIGFDTISRKTRFTPGQVLQDGVPLDVIPGERKATSIHLPPPVIINLREEADPQADKLTPEQLEYFSANGNNALIFVHGYNVPHGEWGRFVKGVRRNPNPRSPLSTLEWHPYNATVKQDPKAIRESLEHWVNDEGVNGSGLHNCRCTWSTA